MTINRRGQTRFPINLQFTVSFGRRQASGLTRDLARTALFVPVSPPPARGTAAELTLRLPGGTAVCASCRVVRTSRPPAGPAGAALALERVRGGGKALDAFFAAMPAAALKDRAPRETISLARRLLKKIRLRPVAASVHSAGRNFHSVHLVDARLPIFVNGKGLTPEYAMASAYGEFMERIQNKTLLPGKFGLMPGGKAGLVPLAGITFGKLLRDHPEVMKALVAFPLPRGAAGLSGRKLACLPFYGLEERRVVHLPFHYISRTCGSNGMCAGNTPEEALAQGLAEVVERQAMRLAFCTPRLRLPTIPHSRIGSAGLRRKIRALEAAGLKVTIKDCTFGGRFPVLGTLVTSARTQCYTVNFGAAATFDVALERCLTEAFQGKGRPVSPITFADPPSASARRYEFYAACRNGTGKAPAAMFLDGGAPAFEPAFLKTFQSNRNALKHLLDCLRMNGARLYVHDCSHLGFPAYRLYVPGYTELARMNRDIRLDHEEMREKVKRTALRLKSAGAAGAASLARTLEGMFRSNKFDFESRHFLPSYLLASCGIKLRNPNDFTGELCGSREKLLALLYHRAGNPAKAAGYLRAHLEAAPSEAAPYMKGCLAFLTQKAAGLSNEAAREGLAGFFGRALAEQVAGDMGRPERVFRYYKLPSCGRCSGCEVRARCYYPVWKEVMAAYRRQVAREAVSQERLAGVFSGLQA